MNKDKYINDVLKNIHTDRKTKDRIKEDLVQRIEMAEENDPFFDIVSEVGDPRDVAKEFMENLDIEQPEMLFIGTSYSLTPYEYKSEKTLFGLPLIHINTGGRYQNKVAKGIIAVGDISFGLVSAGGVAIGLVSAGGLGIGIVSMGGLALGGLALGGVAIGGIALGGIAIGGVAIGAIALGFSKAIGVLPHLLK